MNELCSVCGLQKYGGVGDRHEECVLGILYSAGITVFYSLLV